MDDINKNIEEELEGEEKGLILDNESNIYPLKEIRIDKGRMSVFEFKRKFDDPEKGHIILNPDFQRNDGVWGIRQKSELIESMIMGIPLPVIYLFQNENGQKQVVDGRQRLSTIADFLNNKFKLSGLEIFNDLNKKYFKELEVNTQNKIEDYQLEIYTILPPAPERVKFNIFDRLNRGGTKLTNQEMRNALYQGTSTKLLKEMSELKSFKDLLGGQVKSTKMKDRYIILRFLAFYLFRNDQLGGMEYIANIDEFLKKVMQYINTQDISKFSDIKDKFDKAMQVIKYNYDENVFRFKSKDEIRKRPINMALFECVTYMFILAMENKMDIDINKFEFFKANEFDKPEYFTYGIDSKDNVNFRFDGVERFLGIRK